VAWPAQECAPSAQSLGVDAVAFFEMLLLHPCHVLLDDRRRVAHALRGERRRLHAKREPDGGR
jgi:hypothetical protein